MSENICDMCIGSGKWSDKVCVYCNGTGEYNDAASSYVKNHECQCIVLDRKFCPVCQKICHHDTTFSPRQIIDDGYGGCGAAKGNPGPPDRGTIEEDMLVA